MNGEIPLPILMDGATATNLKLRGLPPKQCQEQWILQNPQVWQQLAKEFMDAGSRMVYTPTAMANRDGLNHFGLGNQTAEINYELARLTVQTAREAKNHVLVAGCIAPLEIQAEPFGETPFMDIVNIYAEQAFALKKGGVDLLVADTMTSLSQCRAAILGCRQTKLPLMVTLNVEHDGETSLGCDLVSALIVCQSLGAAAFGLSCSDQPRSIYGHLEEIAPYASIPLIAKPDAGVSFDSLLPPRQMAKDMVGLWERGAVITGGCCYTTPAHIAAIKTEMDQFPFHSVHLRLDTNAILIAGETEPYFLDEFFEQSAPIICSMDMSDQLLEAESSGADVITIQVDTGDDAYRFALNAHMLHLPVSFLSDNEEALEMALLMYPGRAFVDSRSLIEEEALKTIAEGYGAIIR